MRHPNWSYLVRTKSRNVYDVGEGKGHDDECVNYHESKPLNLNINTDVDDVIEITQNDRPQIEAEVAR